MHPLAMVLAVVLVVPSAWSKDLAGVKTMEKVLRKPARLVAKQLSGKVLVADLSDLSDRNFTSEFGQKAGEIIAYHLLKPASEDYQLVERHELGNIVRDSMLIVGDDAEALAQLSKNAGMDMLVSGTYSVVENEVAVNIKAVEAKTGALLASGQARLRRTPGIDRMLGHRFSRSDGQEEPGVSAGVAQAAPPTAEVVVGPILPGGDVLELDAGVFFEGGDGKLYPVREGMVLNSKDNYAIYLKPGQPCYVYVYQVDSSQKATRLFPNADFTSMSNPLKAGVEGWVPDKNEFLYLDENPGREEIFVFATRTPSPSLEGLREITSTGIQQAIRTMGVAGRRGSETMAKVRGTQGNPLDLITRRLSARGDFFYRLAFIHQ
ncbi:MAG: DUF4384 domain-containing protein [Elusimicrobia bacterium]|nr:DUF4384 domain-containing protein [Elusimicrobiota bacterium]